MGFLVGLCWLGAVVAIAPPRPDIVVADFDGGTWAGWVATGDAFGDRPAPGTLPGQMEVSGHVGPGLVNSYVGGDGPTGTLTSPPFRIERSYLNFLVGGGQDSKRLTMDLLVDGRVVRSVTGPNDRPGGSERLSPAYWPVAELNGRLAVLRITDQASGGWGHINIDQIVQSDRKAQVPVPQQATIKPTGRYLHLPVRAGAERVNMVIEATPSKPEHRFSIELATDGEPEWWAPADLGQPLPAAVRVSVDRLNEGTSLAQLVRFSDNIIGSDNLYHEPLRPRFHFSAKRGWINDPNGLVWQDGEWHLFFQHNPWGWGDGVKYWGHAVSTDLLHWQELDEALYPDRLGPMWSGSAVIDEQRTSGLGAGGKPPLIAIYTAAGERASQCIAYSDDRGRTLTKWAGNPVLPHIEGINRDPKVIWYEPQQKWVMALFLDREDYALFESRDLKAWTKIDDVQVGGCGECPEFFPIDIEGEPGQQRWVFYGGNGRYRVGNFDGRHFAPEDGPQDLHHGNCWYASQTFTGVPVSDGRRIQIGWGTVNLPGMPFNQQMAFPCEMTLHRTAEGLRLRTRPAREVVALRQRSHDLLAGPIAEGSSALPGSGGLYDIEVVLEPGGADQVGLEVRGFPVSYDVADSRLTVNGQSTVVPLINGLLKVRLLVDVASIEAWAQDGVAYLPVQAVAPLDRQTLALTAKGSGARLVSGSVHELKSIWP